MLQRHKKQGQALIELTTLIVFILLAFLVSQKYIVRGITGRWKTVGDALGGGAIYDPKKTLECAFDPQYTKQWYSVTCYERTCITPCLTVAATEADCTACIVSCIPPPDAEPNCDD